MFVVVISTLFSIQKNVFKLVVLKTYLKILQKYFKINKHQN